MVPVIAVAAVAVMPALGLWLLGLRFGLRLLGFLLPLGIWMVAEIEEVISAVLTDGLVRTGPLVPNLGTVPRIYLNSNTFSVYLVAETEEVISAVLNC